MGIKLGTNIAALQATRRLNRATDELSTVFARLSSGQRINSAADDAAGLSVAEALNAKSRIFNQGVRNLGDGLSLLNVADSAIESLSDIVIRIEELATQAANGVYGKKQRAALNIEAQELKKEYLRIIKGTEFNGRKILTSEGSSLSLQAGIGNAAILQVGIGGDVGTGTFGASVSYATEGGNSNELLLADLNGDGILDIVTAGNSGGGRATVQLGLGGGTFAVAVSYVQESGNSGALGLGDLNGDGILDLVTAGTGGGGRGTVRLGTGSGTFGAATSFATEPIGGSRALALGDLNGDGLLDLVTAGYGGGGFATVRLGTGSGTFGVATSFSSESSISIAVTLGDLNGDGILDLVTSGISAGVGRATVRLGTGNGSFGAATSYTAEANSSNAVKLGDLNGDGVLDLVTSGIGGGTGRATVRLGTGDGTFGAATSYSAELNQSSAISLGDLNGDGFLDLVTAGYDDGAITGAATVRLGAGNGTFGASTSFTTESGASAGLALGDINGDGVLDIATAGSGGGGGQATIRFAQTVDGVSPLLDFSLASVADARQALPFISVKRQQLAEQRSVIGASLARIGVASNVLSVSRENFIAAESRIRDADIAEETSRLVRLSILQQAASAVLAQANQQPAIVTKLLTG